jgi:hypothetical protein
MVTTQLVQMLRPLRVSEPPASDSTERTPASTGPPIDTRTVPEPASSEDFRYLTGIEAGVSWTHERLTLQSRAGVAASVHHRPAHWGELGVVYRTRPDLGWFARVRSSMDVPGLEPVHEPNAVLGVQLELGGAAATTLSSRDGAPEPFRMERLAGARHRLAWHVAASAVQVRGDVTDWMPVEARQTSPGRWEVELELLAGVHRIAMRIDDGPWQPMTGLPVVPDEFGGEVGLLVVE